MKVLLLFILLSFTTSLLAQDGVIVECVMRDGDTQEMYQVFRKGDALMARYRLAPSREVQTTDDIAYTLYEGSDLAEYNQDGKVTKMAQVAGISFDRIKSVSHFGIIESDDGQYFRQIWVLVGPLGQTLAKLYLESEDFLSCHKTRFL